MTTDNVTPIQRTTGHPPAPPEPLDASLIELRVARARNHLADLEALITAVVCGDLDDSHMQRIMRIGQDRLADAWRELEHEELFSEATADEKRLLRGPRS